MKVLLLEDEDITNYAKDVLGSLSVHPYDYILKSVNKNRIIILIQGVYVKIEI